MRVKETTSKGSRMSRKIRAVWATLKLLYRLDAWAFLLSVSTGIAGGLFYPLFLLIVWKAFLSDYSKWRTWQRPFPPGDSAGRCALRGACRTGSAGYCQ